VNKDIIKRIQKLFNLADSSKNSNVEEAAAAAAKAQALMEKHRIKRAMLEVKDDLSISSKPLLDKGRPDNWKLYLVTAISKHNGCYIVKSETYEKDNMASVVGEPQDINTVQELYSFVVKELIRLCLSNLISLQKLYGSCPDKSYNKSFYLGAVSTIDKRLEQANKKMRDDEIKKARTGDEKTKVANALARLDNKAQKAKEWINNNMNAKIKNVPINTIDTKAYNAGMKAAKSLPLIPSKPKLTQD
jgi:hypothetical protein